MTEADSKKVLDLVKKELSAKLNKELDDYDEIPAEIVEELLAEEGLFIYSEYKDKLKWISDGYRVGLHPLTPTLRTKWKLVPITESDATDSKDKKRVLAS